MGWRFSSYYRANCKIYTEYLYDALRTSSGHHGNIFRYIFKALMWPHGDFCRICPGCPHDILWGSSLYYKCNYKIYTEYLYDTLRTSSRHHGNIFRHIFKAIMWPHRDICMICSGCPHDILWGFSLHYRGNCKIYKEYLYDTLWTFSRHHGNILRYIFKALMWPHRHICRICPGCPHYILWGSSLYYRVNCRIYTEYSYEILWIH